MWGREEVGQQPCLLQASSSQLPSSTCPSGTATTRPGRPFPLEGRQAQREKGTCPRSHSPVLLWQSLPLASSPHRGGAARETAGKGALGQLKLGRGHCLGFLPPSGLAPPPITQPAPTHCQWKRRSDAARTRGQRPRRAEAERAAANSGPPAGAAEAVAVAAAPWTPWGPLRSRFARDSRGAAPPAGERRGQRVRSGRPGRVQDGRRVRAGGHAPPRCAPCPGVRPAAPGDSGPAGGSSPPCWAAC